ncbi:hypothetical protein [Alicycliphilus denitrificans]|uniref:hypothetical protein n=1 Tax=Alicycliphilus denitrificans TaxID=179636 RepID=UPI003A80E9B6
MFDAPREGEFTQGTVFSCAYAEDYPLRPAYGLVITARCDAVQDKTPIFSYLPIISLKDWMLCDGANIVMDRIRAACKGEVRKALKDASLSESLLETKTMDEIYQSHFKSREVEKAWASRCVKLQATINSLAQIQQLRDAPDLLEQRRLHLVGNTSVVDVVLKELSGNRLAGFYLLREMPSLSGELESFVALLREIHHIPTGLTREIVAGLAKDAWAARAEGQRCPRYVDTDDLAAPVAKLKSPWIEHVMQNFTMLFARIGVADNDFSAVKQSLSPIGLG